MAVERVVNVTEFKAKCLAMIAEVESGDVVISLTRRGKTVAILQLPASKKTKSVRNSWAGRVTEAGDLAATDISISWDIVNGRPWPK
jgi:antitoxin (DNA-binding transcriptional repressor) of toxin-antitoxin stability system